MSDYDDNICKDPITEMVRNHYAHKRLLKEVTETIARDPSVVPALMDAIKDGMNAWQQSVKRHLDSNSDIAIMAAVGLPQFRTKDWLSVENPSHRNAARALAVGWNLATRTASSEMERKLVEFVRAADASNPEDAKGHYEMLRSLPIPPAHQV